MKILFKKITALLLTVVLCGMMMASCTETTDSGATIPADMTAVLSEAKDYELVYPAGWLVDTTAGMTSVYAEDIARSNVTVTAKEITGELTSIEDYWALFSEQFTATFADFTMLDAEPVDVTVGGAHDVGDAAGTGESQSKVKNAVEGKKYRYTATVGDVKYQWMQVIFTRNATMYIFTYTSTVDGYEGNLEDVNEMLDYLYFR